MSQTRVEELEYRIERLEAQVQELTHTICSGLVVRVQAERKVDPEDPDGSAAIAKMAYAVGRQVERKEHDDD